MDQGVTAGVVEWLVAIAVINATAGVVLYQREIRSLLRRSARRWLPHRRPPEPVGRPIERIAADARRLGPRFRHPPPGVSFARFEGTRRAYDDVLAEGCRALGLEHLFTVLPPGSERDAERTRVERVLHAYGFQLIDAA